MHLKTGLTHLGFQQSKVNPCLFMRGEEIFILYVDDAICLACTREQTSKVIKELTNKGFILTKEGNLSMYFSIQLEKLLDERQKLSQPGFTKKILQNAKLKDNQMHDTPADKILMQALEGEPQKSDIHY